MFSLEEPGRKIRTLAKLVMWLLIIGDIVTGIVLIAGKQVLPGILVIIFGSIGSWISALYLAAFGALVESSEETSLKSDTIIRRLENVEKAIRGMEKPAVPESPARAISGNGSTQETKQGTGIQEFAEISPEITESIDEWLGGQRIMAIENKGDKERLHLVFAQIPKDSTELAGLRRYLKEQADQAGKSGRYWVKEVLWKLITLNDDDLKRILPGRD